MVQGRRHLADALSALKAIAVIAEREAASPRPAIVVAQPKPRTPGWAWWTMGVVGGVLLTVILAQFWLVI